VLASPDPEPNYTSIPEYLDDKILNGSWNWPLTKYTVAAIPRRRHRRIGEAKNPGPFQKISIWDNLCDNDDGFDFDQGVMAQDELDAEFDTDLHTNTNRVVHESKSVNSEPNVEPKSVKAEPTIDLLEPPRPQQEVPQAEAEYDKPADNANRKLTNKERKQLRKGKRKYENLIAETTNTTSWTALLERLRVTKADVVCAQEHHCLANVIDEKSEIAKGLGWKSFWSAATPTDPENPLDPKCSSGGVAIFVRSYLGTSNV